MYKLHRMITYSNSLYWNMQSGVTTTLIIFRYQSFIVLSHVHVQCDIGRMCSGPGDDTYGLRRDVIQVFPWFNGATYIRTINPIHLLFSCTGSLVLVNKPGGHWPRTGVWGCAALKTPFSRLSRSSQESHFKQPVVHKGPFQALVSSQPSFWGKSEKL